MRNNSGTVQARKSRGVIEFIYFVRLTVTVEFKVASAKDPELTVLTIGYSTRTMEEFIAILKMYCASLVVDVRSVPRSRRNPQFNKETLQNFLKLADVKYVHMPAIGGLRRPKHDSVNIALENKGFRGYADYMQTKEFTENLLNLLALSMENRVAVMCAEASPWRCHRSLIADALVVRNVTVEHILTMDNTVRHRLSEWAHVDGTKITYPLFTKEIPQRRLSDFAAST